MKRLGFMFAAMFAVALCAVSCETEGDLEDYVPPVLSEAVVDEYAPVITKLTPGYDKLRVSWTFNEGADSGITHCYIFNGTDIAEVDMSEVVAYDEPGYDTASVTKDADGVYTTTIPMDEGTYTIYMKSLDSANSLSGKSADESIFVYGEEYEASLSSHRTIIRSTSTEDISLGLTYTITMEESYDTEITGVNIYYIKEVNADAGVELSADKSSQYISYVEGTPEQIYYILDGATKSAEGNYMDIIIETELAPFGGNFIDPVVLTSYKRLSEDATFVTVSSLERLRSYVTKDTEYVNVKMTPGTYTFTMADALAGNFQVFQMEYGVNRPSVLVFLGSYNTYDFSGVTIEIEDDAGDY